MRPRIDSRESEPLGAVALNTRKLRVLCEVVEHQSLTQAANRLAITQPVVSRHIRELEEFFDARLLFQKGRRMVPTEAGGFAYRYAVGVLKATDEAVSSISGLERGDMGHVAIGANMGPGTYFLPPLLVTFRKAHPGMILELGLSDAATVSEDVFSGRLDFAVVAVLTPARGLHAEVLHNEPLVLVAAPSHHLAADGSVSVQQLAAEDFVCWPAYDASGAIVDFWLREVGLVKRRIVMALGHPEAIKHAVKDGIGIALLYRSSVLRELAAGELVEVSIDRKSKQPMVHPFYLVHLPDRGFSPAQQKLLAFLKQHPRTRAAKVSRRAS